MGKGGSQRRVLPYIGAESSHRVLIEIKKGAQRTYQAENVVGSSFRPSVVLLVHPSGPIHPTVDCHGFVRPETRCRSKQTLLICSSVNGVSWYC